ncbi:inorganic phosphate transporter [Micrococcaceae bacterium RIT802]|nr:inorganic phosphate transporter [Micrococcaceae bacterium RIT 802]
MTLLLWCVLVAICAFGFLNGFRDASNSVAAAVRTRALTPSIAVVLAACFTVIGTLLGTAFGSSLIAAVELNVPDGAPGLAILLTAVLAAGGWGLFCWYRAVPMSSTQAVISGFAGASGASALLGGDGVDGVTRMLLGGVVIPLLLTPVIAYALSYLVVIPLTWRLRHASSGDVNTVGRMGQSITTGAVALGHGLQDGQRTAAMLTLALVAGNTASGQGIPFWAQAVAAGCLGAGVLCGGWRITHTIAYRLVAIDPLRGMGAQSVSAAMLFVGAIALHMPLSTTQAVTSSIVGAGANQRFESVVWRRVAGVAAYWLLTPLACIAAAGVLFLAVHPLLG